MLTLLSCFGYMTNTAFLFKRIIQKSRQMGYKKKTLMMMRVNSLANRVNAGHSAILSGNLPDKVEFVNFSLFSTLKDGSYTYFALRLGAS